MANVTRNVTNQTIAACFERLADLMDILGEDSFRITANRKVARVVKESDLDVPALAREGRLTELPGVGKSSAVKITQLVETGKIDVLEELAAKVPEGLPALLGVPGLGPKTVAKLWQQAGVTDLEGLSHAVEDGSLEKVEKLGPKKIRQIWESLQFVASAGKRTRLGDAMKVSDRVLEVLRKQPGVEKVVPAGSLRRGRDTVGDLDFICIPAAMGKAPEIIQAFTEDNIRIGVQSVLAAGETKASVRLDRDIQADLRVVPAESYGAALAYFTGSKDHNVHLRELAVKKKLKLNEYGLFKGEKPIAGATEEEIYAALALQYIPPELRENTGEIEAAAENRLPTLVEPTDIRGDLHMHTLASDGAETIEAMIEACLARGYKYMAITDHSQSQPQAHGMDKKRLLAHAKAVRAAARPYEKKIAVYFSCEVDILKDGSLDFPDSVLAEMDFAVASPHAGLTMKRAEATARILKAIENPHVRVIGHPTGRLINSRPGMELDIEKIAAAAAERGVALEVNANYHRLDLRDTHVRTAIAKGAKIAICTDAHSTGELEMMKFGVITARRGWATKEDVVNAWPAEKFDRWVRRA